MVDENTNDVGYDAEGGDAEDAAATTTATSWIDGLGSADLKANPSLKRYESVDKLAEGYLNLEKMLGNEKIPWPKDDKDQAGWQRVYDKLGVPKGPEGYQMDDVQMPAELKGMAFDKAAFAKIAHEAKLTPGQTKALWSKYGETVLGSHQKAINEFKGKVENAKAALMQEWGDAFEVKKELAQRVLNTFSGDKDTADFLAAAIGSNPLGMKFFAKIGEHFSEHNVGDFGTSGTNFTKTPTEAQSEVDKILANPFHPYHGNHDQAGQPISHTEHMKAVELFETLFAQANAGKK